MNSNREIIVTADGSKTIYFKDLNESYHSKNGAIQEAFHVFIRNGLDVIPPKTELFVIEFGLGTALNCLITFLEAENRKQKIYYAGIEKYPIIKAEYFAMNYFESVLTFFPLLENRKNELFKCYQTIYEKGWNGYFEQLSPYFHLKKLHQDFFDISLPLDEKFDLVYFDAFGPKIQPELWDEKLFSIIYNLMRIDGLFTTYSSKSSVQRALKEVGFIVKKVAGPKGKREMINAQINNSFI